MDGVEEAVGREMHDAVRPKVVADDGGATGLEIQGYEGVRRTGECLDCPGLAPRPSQPTEPYEAGVLGGSGQLRNARCPGARAVHRNVAHRSARSLDPRIVPTEDRVGEHG